MLSTDSPHPTHRLDFLDGLRALAAFYVVTIHIHLEAAITAHSTKHAASWNSFGPVAVGAFITLSGYCLTISLTQSARHTIPVGTARFLYRRAKRLLPPYYAAIALCLFTLAFRHLTKLDTVFWHNGSAALSLNIVSAHVLLVNNLSPLWACTIEYPMWSIAAEAQLYLIFPLLIAIKRRYGLIALVNSSLVLSALASFFLFYLSPQIAADNVCLIILFVLGMSARFIGSAPENPKHRWMLFSCCAVAIICILSWLPGKALHTEVLYLLSGIMMLGMMIFCTHKLSRLRSYLEWKPLVSLGRVSYSLYLTHVPILAVTHAILVAHGNGSVLALAAVGLPASIIFSYAFGSVFERNMLWQLLSRRSGVAEVKREQNELKLRP